MSAPNDLIEFRYAPRPDITAAERLALAPYRDDRTIPVLTYYQMGPEARHLLVGPAMRNAVRSN